MLLYLSRIVITYEENLATIAAPYQRRLTKPRKSPACTHARVQIPIGVIGDAIECVPNGRFAKENEINKESAR